MQDDGSKRQFDSGAKRDTAKDKLDYAGFLSPMVLKRFAEYNLNRENYAWAAGVFEGEGSITHNRSTRKGKKYTTPRLAMSLTDYDVISRFQKIMGGTLRGPYQPKQKNRQPIWYWQAGKAEGVEILKRIYPYLGHRRQNKVTEKFGIVGLAEIAGIPPTVIVAFGKYMHENRFMSDGTIRDSDDWQKGIPKEVYMSSMWRHFMDVWLHDRGHSEEAKEDLEIALVALMFNVMGYLHEELNGN